MSPADDAEAADLWVDHLLQQALGDEAPPDLAARVAAAPAERLAAAAAAVDAAERERRAEQAAAPRQRFGSWWLVAATLGLVAVGAWFAFGRTPPSAEVRYQALLDEFHGVMPRNPALLRVASWRERSAARAIPVIRAILGFDTSDAGRHLLGGRTMEFEVFGAVLGDAEMVASLRRRAAAGDGAADGQLAIVDATLAEGEPRDRAIQRLVDCLRQRPANVANLLWCLTVTELTPAEAERLAQVIDAPELRRYVFELADRAGGVSAWLDAPIDLFGRLADDRLFSTSELRGRVVLVYFWATWCAPCARMIERVRQLHAQHPELAIVGVSCDHDPAALRRHLAANPGDDWVQFFDATRPGWHEFALRHRVQSIPFAVVLDRDGIVREVDAESFLEDAVARLLKK